MQERMEALINFIDKYGEEYLSDGTKEKVIDSLKNGNKEIALELLDSMDVEWIKRTKDLEKFYIFTDWEKFDSEHETLKPYFKANYIDSSNGNISHIPVLRKIKPRQIEIPNFPCKDNDWEI